MADVLSMVSREPTESDFSELQGILPEQFYGARRGTSEVEPLRRLMIAMLVDAVRCFETKFDARQPATRQEFAEVRSGSSLTQTTACSPSEPCAMRLELTLELFAKGSLAGRKTGLPAGGGGQFDARHCPLSESQRKGPETMRL
jgi:hypothetical protein